MRTIDADALKELFSEVIGHIAKKIGTGKKITYWDHAGRKVIDR